MNRSSISRTPPCPATKAAIGCRIPAAASSPSARNASVALVAAHEGRAGQGAGAERSYAEPSLDADPHPRGVHVRDRPER